MTEPQKPIFFTQPGCSDSAKVRRWLNEHGIDFTEHSVTDADSAKALAATGVFATPLLVVGERHVLGLRPEELTAALREDRPT